MRSLQQPARRALCAWGAWAGWTTGAGWPLVGARQAFAQAAPPAADVPAQEAQAPPLPAPGQPLALPEMELLDGQRFVPAHADGRVLLVYWWASWCPFCALTSPHVDKLWQAQRHRGLAMLTLAIDRRADDARAYLQRRGYAWPTAWVSPALQRRLPKPKGLPVTVMRGRDGRVLQAEGGQLFPEDVEALARHVG
jgi:thiol-disulfide isomerase/thioredoxin